MRFSIGLTNLFLLAILATPARSADPVGTVHGSGIFGTTRGEFPNHQPFIDMISVNATVYADGSAGGTIVWMSTHNAEREPGQGTSGWTWQIRVEAWYSLEDGTVILEGTVTHSQLEEEVGLFLGVGFYDGGANSPDSITGAEIRGNIRIEGP